MTFEVISYVTGRSSNTGTSPTNDTEMPDAPGEPVTRTRGHAKDLPQRPVVKDTQEGGEIRRYEVHRTEASSHQAHSEQAAPLSPSKSSNKYPRPSPVSVSSSRGERNLPKHSPAEQALYTSAETPMESREVLAQEIEFQKGAQQKLEKRIAELEGEIQRRDEEVAQKAAEAEDFRKLWKKAGAELNKTRAMAQGFYQITDQYLIDVITQLRFTIREFAIQFFDDNPVVDSLGIVDPHYLDYLEDTTLDKKGYLHYLTSPKECQQIIQAFIWNVLIGKVFNNFVWVGAKPSDDVFHLRRMLQPKRHADSSQRGRPDPEAERKFQMWSATTVGLLLEVVDSDKSLDVEKHMRGQRRRLGERISNTIGGWIKYDKRDFMDQIYTILDKAYALDKEISRQVGRVVWLFDLDEQVGGSKFDPTAMELETGDHTKDPKHVDFVVAPGVNKRGKSNGQGFKQEVGLLKMVVRCQE